MDRKMERLLLSEIKEQSNIAFMARDDLSDAVNHLPQDDSVAMIRIWYSISAFLMAVGNVSKILWPIRKQSKSRGNHLRNILNIKDGASVLENRSVRDAMEHFDERLEFR